MSWCRNHQILICSLHLVLFKLKKSILIITKSLLSHKVKSLTGSRWCAINTCLNWAWHVRSKAGRCHVNAICKSQETQNYSPCGHMERVTFYFCGAFTCQTENRSWNLPLLNLTAITKEYWFSVLASFTLQLFDLRKWHWAHWIFSLSEQNWCSWRPRSGWVCQRHDGACPGDFRRLGRLFSSCTGLAILNEFLYLGGIVGL